MLARFFWMIDGALAGCSLPGQRGRGAPAAGTASLEQDLAWLRSQGIGALLSLTEAPLDEQAIRRASLAAAHLPVPDLRAPAPEQFISALQFIDRQRAEGRAIAVHCLAGQGRTCTVLAAYLIRAGHTAPAAIASVRAVCPGAIESPEQVHALAAFAAGRDWLL